MKSKNLLPYNYLHYYLFSIVIGILSIKSPIFLILYLFLFCKIKDYKYLYKLILFTAVFMSYLLIRLNINYKKPLNNNFKVINIKTTTYNNQYIVKQGLNKYLMYSNKDLKIGDNIILNYELREFVKEKTPNGFNYKNYYASKNIYYELKVKDINVIKNSFHLNKIRYFLKQKFNNFPKHTKSYIEMFVFGEDTFTEEFNEAKRKLGIVHLFALSGLHVHLLIGFINKLFKLFKKEPNNIIILTVLIIYLFLAGNTFSLLRAVLMVLFILFLKHKGLSSLDSLALSFFVILLIYPYAMYNYGFILSFLISFFIITMPLLTGIKKLIYMHLISYFSSLLIISNLNGGIYVLTIFTSLLYSFVFPFIMQLVFLSLIPKVYLIAEPILDFINKVSIKMALSPIIKFAYQPTIVIVIYLLLVIYVCLANYYKQIIKRSILVFIYLCIIYMSFYTNPFYKVDFLDVSQGDSTLIKNPYNKSYILIDTHTGTYNYLQTLGPVTIDYLFITHGDYDHASEAVKIVKNIKVNNIYLNPYDNSKIAKELLKLNAKRAFVGDVFKSGYTTIEVLGPLKDYFDDNDNSLVLKINTFNETILFTGDITSAAEIDLANYYKSYLSSNILHIAHHGSNSSTTDLFLNYVNPEEAIISVGKYNIYNHPSEIVVNKLLNKGIKIYLTSQKQTITKRKYYSIILNNYY